MCANKERVFHLTISRRYATPRFFIACHGDPQNGPEPSVKTTPATSPTVAPAVHKQEAWLGRWNGPVGTYLLLSRKADLYKVKIQSLDGKVERIKAGSGKETEMKWLLEKTDCLIIKEGEGFCRK